jgi:hypothetical protein
MNEGGGLLLAAIGGIIGICINYLIVKEAVLAALKKHEKIKEQEDKKS